MSKTQYIIAGASPDLLSPIPVPFPIIPGLVLRLRPDLGMVSSGGNITSWTDQSLNAGVFTQHPSASGTPTVGDLIINGKTVPAAYFVKASSQALQNSSGSVWIPTSAWFDGLVMLVYYWPTWLLPSFLYTFQGPSRFDAVMMSCPQKTGSNYIYALSIYGGNKNSWSLTNPESIAHCMFATTLIVDSPNKSIGWYDSDDGGLNKATGSVAMNNNCNKVNLGVSGGGTAWAFGAGYILELNVWNQTVSYDNLLLLQSYVTNRYGITFA